MSDYCREKVLRYPVEEDPWEIENRFSSLFATYKQLPSFQVAPTDKEFIDYVLESDYGCTAGDWGRTRALTKNEQDKYRPIFNQIFKDIDMNKVRLVEYCWYNCSEAPDYYDEDSDDFGKEV